MFFLKWKGYADECNTWEPASNLYCTHLLDAYKKKFNLNTSFQTLKSQASESKLNRKHDSSDCGSTIPGPITSPSSDYNSKHKEKSVQNSVHHDGKMRSMSKTEKTHVNGKGTCLVPNGELQVTRECLPTPTSNGMQSQLHTDKKEMELPLVVKENGIRYLFEPKALDRKRSLDTRKRDLKRKLKSKKLVVSINVEHLGEGGLRTKLHSSVRNPNYQVCSSSANGSTTNGSSSTDQCTFTTQHYLMCINHDHGYFSPSSLDCTGSVSVDLNEDYSSSSSVYGPISPFSNPAARSAHTNSSVCEVESSPLSSRCNRVPAEDSDSSVISINSEPYDEPNLCVPILPTPRVNNDMKLYLSPSSSSTDLDVCDVEDESNHEELFQPNTKYSSFSHYLPNVIQKRAVPILQLSKSDSTGNNLPRWRKGPVPLPRSFSSRYSSSLVLQTKAAKIQQLEKRKRVGGGVRKRHLFRCRQRLKRSLTQQLHCDENKTVSSQPNKTPLPVITVSLRERRLSYEHVSECAYKEHLMNWQYELNKQRDGTDDIIYVENEVDRVPPPLVFNYICSNIYRKGVPDPDNLDLRSSLCGCECYYLGRKCGPKSQYCCAHMAGSEFAYSQAGKVRVAPGTPIYECNPKCACPSSCINRIVQLGRKIPLCIFRTIGRGWGVKTMQPLKCNTFVSEYVGEVITNEEAERRGEMCDAQGITYLFDLDFEDDNSAFTIDAANYGNISHFFNHSVSIVSLVYF